MNLSYLHRLTANLQAQGATATWPTETRKLTPDEMDFIGMGESPRPTQAQHMAEADLLAAMSTYTRSLSIDRIAAAIATAAIARWGAARTERLGELISRAAWMEGRK